MLIKCEKCIMWGRVLDEKDTRKCFNPLSEFYNRLRGKTEECPQGIDIASSKNKEIYI